MKKYKVKTETEVIVEADNEYEAREKYWIGIEDEPQQTMGTYFEGNTEVEEYFEDSDESIMKTSNKNCFSCGCTDYDVKFRKEFNEWYCDNCCEGMS